MRFGDSYMRVLGRSVVDVPRLKNFELSNNRLTEAGATKVLKKVAQRAVRLDLANNRIGMKGAETIAQVLEQKDSRLNFLNLENNALPLPAVHRILTAITTARSFSQLRVLDLSNNSLQDGVSEDFAHLLREGRLLELYLHWNSLRARFGATFFDALRTCETLRVLDLSNNKLGRQSEVHSTVLGA